jgi:hypothetical protein
MMMAQNITTAEAIEEAMEAARREIAQGRYIWPYFLAYGQRPG